MYPTLAHLKPEPMNLTNWTSVKHHFQMRYYSPSVRLSTLKILPACCVAGGAISAFCLNSLPSVILSLASGFAAAQVTKKLAENYESSHTKALANEAGLTKNILVSVKGEFAYFSEIFKDRLYVGGQPLITPYGFDKIFKILGITDVVSTVQLEEFAPKLGGVSVIFDPKSDHWLLVECPDNQVFTYEQLDKSLPIFHERFKDLARKFYIHCKGGKGRSVSFAILYAVLYQQQRIRKMMGTGKEVGPLEFLAYMEENLRPEVKAMNQIQRQFLQDYYDYALDKKQKT